MTGKRPCKIISGTYRLGFKLGTNFRIFATASVLVGMADTYKCILSMYQVFPYDLDLPVYSIWILTSLAFGGATSTSSTLRGSPAPQQTAALHLIVVPTVDDI